MQLCIQSAALPQLLFLIDVTVSLPAMIGVGEGDGSVKVCTTLYSNGSIEKDFIITLGTSDGTGNTTTHIARGKIQHSYFSFRW